MYGRLFETLADQHHTLVQAAFDLFEEAVNNGLDLPAMKADGALLQLGLAEISENVESIDGELPPVDYIDSRERREKERVRAALMGDEEDDYE